MLPVVLEPVLLRGHEQVFERALRTVLKHDAELVGAIVPATAHQIDEVLTAYKEFVVCGSYDG